MCSFCDINAVGDGDDLCVELSSLRLHSAGAANNPLPTMTLTPMFALDASPTFHRRHNRNTLNSALLRGRFQVFSLTHQDHRPTSEILPGRI